MNLVRQCPPRIVRVLLLSFGVLLAVVAPGGRLDAAPSGSVSGTVTDTSGVPLEDICVRVTPEDTTVLTDALGGYTVGGLTAGDHTVQFSDCGSPATHVTQWYLGQPDEGFADTITIADGVDTELSTVKMEPGVVIAGAVTDGFGDPVQDISVRADSNDTGRSSSAQSQEDGSYRTNPLPKGNYSVSFSDPASDPAWATQYWSGRHSEKNADVLVLDPDGGSEATGVDAVMTGAASVSGTVTDADDKPFGNVCVDAHEDGSVAWLAGTETAGDGTYRIVGLPAVGVLVSFSDCNGSGYAEQWFDGAADSDGAASLALSGGVETTGVDARMTSGFAIAGRVTEPGGNPIEGIDVYLEPDNGGPTGWARTDSNGDYVSSALGLGQYRVQFRHDTADPVWATEYWDDRISRSDADLVDISGDQQVIGGIDAVLAAAATVTGSVTDAGGDPLEKICVGAVSEGSDGEPVGWTETKSDGTYQLAGLPATTVQVVFDDCNGIGPFSMQWFDGVSDRGEAKQFSLVPGETTTGVDAVLALSGLIEGKVVDPGGKPIQGVCVQATTLTNVGGFGLTDDNGTYRIQLAKAGDYRVQFVDCGDPSEFGGTWWGGGLDPATARFIPVDPGEVVGNVDATLQPAATGHLTGRVTNVRGDAMEGVCAVVFLPDRHVLFAPTDADGNYDVPALPSGSWTVGFLDCAVADESGPATVTDPVTGITYQAIWHDGAFLTVKNEAAPDPLAQGAELVTVGPAQTVEIGACFGCTAIEATDVTQDNGLVTVAFDTPGLVPADSGFKAAASAPTYALVCDSGAGVTASEERSSSPVLVSGLLPGSSNQCFVVGAVDGRTVARSAAFSVSVAADAEDDGGNGDGETGGTSPDSGQPDSGGTSADPTSTTPAQSSQPLAVTGGNAGSAALVAALSLLLGALALAVGRMTSRPPIGSGWSIHPKRSKSLQGTLP